MRAAGRDKVSAGSSRSYATSSCQASMPDSGKCQARKSAPGLRKQLAPSPPNGADRIGGKKWTFQVKRISFSQPSEPTKRGPKVAIGSE